MKKIDKENIMRRYEFRRSVRFDTFFVLTIYGFRFLTNTFYFSFSKMCQFEIIWTLETEIFYFFHRSQLDRRLTHTYYFITRMT